MWFYSFASPILLYLFIFLPFSHSSAPSVSEPSVLYNQQHRLLLMNGKINTMHFVIISFAVSRCLSPCFIFPPSLCFTPFPSLPLFTPPCPLQPLFTSPWKSTLPIFMHSSCFHEPSSPLPTHPSHLSIFSNPPSPTSQYFDEEQDDHEYPYYYEETTDVPSASAHPSPQPGAPNQQVKREQERQKGREGE